MKKFQSYLCLGSVFILQLLIFLFNSRFDPDPHHDGLIFTGAVASSDGLIPNRDFFAQYGPLTPFIQGLFLHVTSATLFNLRLLMAIFLALNGLMLYYVAAKLRGSPLGVVLTFIWVFELSARIPWPSILSTSILLLALLLLIDFDPIQIGLTLHKPRIVLAGFLLGSTPFIRIHNLIMVVLLFSLMFLIKRSKTLVLLTLSYLSSTLAGILILVATNGFYAFVIQCIVWPIGKYATPDLSKSYLIGILWYPVITLFSFLYFVLVSRFFGSVREERFLFPYFVLSIFWVVICIGLIIPRNDYLSFRNPKIIFIDTSFNFTHFIGYASVGLCLFYSFKISFGKNKQDLDLLVSVFAIGSISQLYPLYDQVHLWFITPILVFCALVFIRNVRIPIPALNAITLSLIPFILVLSAFAIVDWRLPRTPYSSPILSGLYGDPLVVKNVDSTIDLLSKNYTSGGILFSCPNGLYAAYDGVYRSRDANYVDWSPGFEHPVAGETYFVCDIPKKDYEKLLNKDIFLGSYHYKINNLEFYSAILKSN